MNGVDSDLGRCETIGLSATPQPTTTSPSNLALPAHRPALIYDTYILYGAKRVQNNSAPQSLSEPGSHTNGIVNRMKECRRLVPDSCWWQYARWSARRGCVQLL